MNLISKGKASEAGEVFELMKKAGVKPETAVYNTLIAGYGRQGDAKESFHLFNQVSILLYLYHCSAVCFSMECLSTELL